MGQQIARLTKEAAFNTFPGTVAPYDPTVSPVPAGAQTELFLPMSNAVTVLPMPQFWEIRDAGVSNRVAKKSVGRVNVAGSFQTYGFPSQLGMLLGLAAGLTGTAPCLDLPSFTMDRGIFLEDGSCGTAYRRYTGCKMGNFTLSADNTDQGCLLMVKGDVIGSTPRTITGTDFPYPDASAYPTDDPYLFYQVAGHLTIGSALTNFQSLTLSIANVLKSFPDENKYAQSVRWFGRVVTLSVKLLFKSAADRLAFEAGTKQAVSVKFDSGVSGSRWVQFDLGGVCNLDAVEDDLPIDDYFTQNLTLTALIDPTLGTPTDLTITTGVDA